MKFIAEIKEFSENSNNPDLSTMINFPLKDKSVILRFLKSFKPIAVMAHSTKDYIKNISNNDESVSLFNSDEWFWTNEIIYHFEKYNLKLNDNFIEYVLKRS